MRTISELLTILRDNAEVVNNGILFGLCHEVRRLHGNDIISREEKFSMIDYITNKMPYSEFKGPFGVMLKNIYGWPVGEWEPRFQWLNEHIKLTKVENTEISINDEN